MGAREEKFAQRVEAVDALAFVRGAAARPRRHDPPRRKPGEMRASEAPMHWSLAKQRVRLDGREGDLVLIPTSDLVLFLLIETRREARSITAPHHADQAIAPLMLRAARARNSLVGRRLGGALRHEPLAVPRLRAVHKHRTYHTCGHLDARRLLSH